MARLLEALPHRMLGSHLTLIRTLATYILLVRLQPQPPSPPHLAVRSWLFDFDIAHPFLLSSRTSRDDFGLQWSSTILLLDAFAKTRRRLGRGSRRRAWTRVTWARCVLLLPLGIDCSLYPDMYLPLLYCIQALVCRLYELLYPCICNAVISC